MGHPPHVMALYELMARSRAVEEACSALWEEGLVSGEYHTSIGEEAVAAGVVAHLNDLDALAVDHRGTAPLVVRGVPPALVIGEVLGSPTGLNAGRAGHMHMADRTRRAAASGIVGASGPLACGMALEAQRTRRGGVAVAFFGEGATNQGMLLESWNLAVVWRLPVIFVCKHSGLAITTTNAESIGAPLRRRARGFGLRSARLRGQDVDHVWRVAGAAVRRARSGRGPSLLLARVHRRDGHFLGDPLQRLFDDPAGQARQLGPPLAAALCAPTPASLGDRARGVAKVAGAATVALSERIRSRRDPVAIARARLDPARVDVVDRQIADEVADAVRAARAGLEAARA